MRIFLKVGGGGEPPGQAKAGVGGAKCWGGDRRGMCGGGWCASPTAHVATRGVPFPVRAVTPVGVGWGVGVRGVGAWWW